MWLLGSEAKYFFTKDEADFFSLNKWKLLLFVKIILYWLCYSYLFCCEFVWATFWSFHLSFRKKKNNVCSSELLRRAWEAEGVRQIQNVRGSHMAEALRQLKREKSHTQTSRWGNAWTISTYFISIITSSEHLGLLGSLPLFHFVLTKLYMVKTGHRNNCQINLSCKNAASQQTTWALLCLWQQEEKHFKCSWWSKERNICIVVVMSSGVITGRQ